VLKIPQPDGWERVTMMDSELIRYAMRNVDLVSDGFALTAVVTLESQPGRASPTRCSRPSAAGWSPGCATDVRTAETTLCGLPAETVDYTIPADGGLPPHPARVVCAVPQTDDRTYAVTVTVQGAEPENPTYKRDSEVILTGFQMLSPAR
jgi:hypothetical protein